VYKKALDHKSARIGVLFSGGPDSAALLFHYLDLGFTVYPVFVRAGLRWEKQELTRIRRILSMARSTRIRPLETAQLVLESAYSKNWSHTGAMPGPKSADSAVYLPARNLLLITKSLLRLVPLGVTNIAIATLKTNPFPDATPDYFSELSRVLSKSFGLQIRIHTPFAHLNKREVIQSYGKFPIHLSFSCLGRKKNHCGRCNKCVERKRAFKLAGVEDTTIYRP
jgi:7-cyano-7-deazaguanine synthase